MGQLNSVLKTMTTPNEETRVPYDESGNNGLIIEEKFIPEELLSEILCLVDHKSLMKCQLVCKCWNALIQSYIWRKKAERTLGHSLPLDDNAPWTMYYFLCDKKPFYKNLIKNHSGHQKLNKEWIIQDNGGPGWKVESPPIGIPELPDDPVFDKKKKKKCFVTSYDKCMKYQVIDLIAEGFTEYLLDNLKPTIKVSEWYGGRWDCESQYCCTIKLLPGNSEEIEVSESLHKYEFSKVLEGEDLNKWFKFEHEIKNYPEGVRKIVFAHAGQDRRFWSGHYGSKMAGACVQLEIPEFHNTKNLNEPMLDLI